LKENFEIIGSIETSKGITLPVVFSVKQRTFIYLNLKTTKMIVN